jgi:hypothetical protein
MKKNALREMARVNSPSCHGSSWTSPWASSRRFASIAVVRGQVERAEAGGKRRLVLFRVAVVPGTGVPRSAAGQ